MDARQSLKDKDLVEHNLLIGSRHKTSATEQNFVYMVLAQFEKDDPVDKIYYVYIKDLEKLTGKELNYKQIDQAAIRLISRVYSIKEKHGMLHVSMISSARYVTGAGKIAIRIDPEIRPYLFSLKGEFTKYRFFMAVSLKSQYSKRMYQMLSQFKNTGIMRISVKEIKERLYLIDPKSGKEKYTIWTMFTKKVFEVAKRELSQCTDISFTYEAKKTGRKFTDLEFKISYKPQQLAMQYGEDSVNTSIYKRLTEKFRLSSWQANLIMHHIPEQEINKALYEIQSKAANGGLNNIGGFTAQTFENKYQLGLMGKNNSGYAQHNASLQEDKYPVKLSKGSERAPSNSTLSIGEHMSQLLKND